MTAWGRWARAMAVLVGIAAVGNEAIVVANRPPGRTPPALELPPAASARDRARINREYLDFLLDEYAPCLDPVPLGSSVTATGGPSFEVRLRADRGDDAGASYTVRIENRGVVPVSGSLAGAGAWLETDDGTSLRPLSTRSTSPGAIARAAEAELLLVFAVPAHTRPTRLRLTLRLGKYRPNVQWDLT